MTTKFLLIFILQILMAIGMLMVTNIQANKAKMIPITIPKSLWAGYSVLAAKM